MCLLRSPPKHAARYECRIVSARPERAELVEQRRVIPAVCDRCTTHSNQFKASPGAGALIVGDRKRHE